MWVFCFKHIKYTFNLISMMMKFSNFRSFIFVCSAACQFVCKRHNFNALIPIRCNFLIFMQIEQNSYC